MKNARENGIGLEISRQSRKYIWETEWRIVQSISQGTVRQSFFWNILYKENSKAWDLKINRDQIMGTFNTRLMSFDFILARVGIKWETPEQRIYLSWLVISSSYSGHNLESERFQSWPGSQRIIDRWWWTRWWSCIWKVNLLKDIKMVKNNYNLAAIAASPHVLRQTEPDL
jgi:hypothetical protein